MTKLADWEITANGSTINSSAPTGAPEGMAPSALNNKIREDNAIIARDYRNRKGILSAGGTSSAYTLTSSEGEAGDNLVTGDAAILVFQAIKKCKADVTLAVDGMAAKAIIDASGNNLSEGDITANTLVEVCYNASTDRWQMMNERASTDAVRAADSTTFTGSNTFSDQVQFDASAIYTSSIFTVASVFDSGLNSINYMDNLALAASVAGNNLTIDVRGKDLNDPSSTNRVNVAFRSENAADGDYDIVQITGALDVTIDAGETLGFSASEDGYIYIYLLNNGGTAELAVAKKALFDDSIVHSSTILDSSADNDSTLYSQTARTSKPVRLVGRLRITHGSDVWDTAPTELSIWHPGMKKTGDIVQTLYTTDGAVATGTTTIPEDDTIPGIAEGDEYMSRSITPTSTINTLRIDAIGQFSHSSTNDSMTACLFQDSGAAAIAVAVATRDPAAGRQVTAVLSHFMAAGTVTSTSFQIRAGAANAGTTTFNGAAAARLFGGVMASSLAVTEIQA